MRLQQRGFIILFATIFLIGYVQGQFRRLIYPQGKTTNQLKDDPGQPLFLTPYLEQGKIEEARQLRYYFSLLFFFLND